MRWTLKPIPEPTIIEDLQQKLNIDKTLAILLSQRGITSFNTAKDFFRPNLEQLHDPFLMKDMGKAVNRIKKAIDNKERILIYGDYDVDGTTAVALLCSYLKPYLDSLSTYIPDRYIEGYGVSFRGIDYANENNISLIIALDCGIKALDKVKYAAHKGIDFIICDHHRPGPQLPEAIAVLNPKREDCNYPDKELCGCGVGFKLIQALAVEEGKTIQDLLPYLDLVVTAIAADIVPITGENRILAYYGLQTLNNNPRTGINAIIKELKKPILTISDVVFIISPRINAAGRMKHGKYAVTLLMETDANLAEEYAAEINTFNSDRRLVEKKITQEALQQIELLNEQENLTTVVFQEHWHKGVIGIVASRLIETYYRPTLVFTKNGDTYAASARSVRGFDIYKALEQCEDFIEQFGGHKYAAGLTLKSEHYEAFKQRFEEVVSKTIDRRLLTPEITIDTPLSISEITPKFYRILKQFAPFGPGNMAPVFIAEGVQDTGYGKCVGTEEKHLKAKLTQNNHTIAAIGFNLGNKHHIIADKKPFNMVYSIEENTWNGNTNLQLKLKDIGS